MFSCQKRHCFYIVCKLRLLYSLYLVNKDIRESYCCLCNWFSTTIHHHSKCRMNHEKVGVRRTEHGLGDSEGMTPKDVCYITMLSAEIAKFTLSTIHPSHEFHERSWSPSLHRRRAFCYILRTTCKRRDATNQVGIDQPCIQENKREIKIIPCSMSRRPQKRWIEFGKLANRVRQRICKFSKNM